MDSRRHQHCDILFLIRSMGRGGAERQLSLLARAMSARGLRVVVAVFYAGGPLERELHEAGVEVLDLKKRGRWSNVDVSRRLMRFVRERRPKVLHSYMPTQNLLALVHLPKLSRLHCAVVCGIRVASLDAWKYGLVAGMVDWIHRLSLKAADLVISNSARALKELHGYVQAGRGISIPNGVECDRYNYSATARSSQRTAWGVGPDEILLGLVGRLDPQKNHALLIQALAVAADDLRRVRVVFVGDGPSKYRADVAAQAESSGVAHRILWAGPSDDLSTTYSALDMLCLCSVTEGFPNVVAEAMCVGLPCVSTDVGDAAHLVGGCGWVVPPNDPIALAAALVQASNSLPTWDRVGPRRRMMQQFSIDALADRTLAALAPFLSRRA
jgi:glycosyltransferase involved in cell wall biosynthesis